jgi:CRP-like cAMP-binding protein
MATHRSTVRVMNVGPGVPPPGSVAGAAPSPAAPREGSSSDLLGRTELFAGLQGAELDRLAQRAATRPVRRGEVVFGQGDPGDALFVVVAGLVKVFVTSAEGEEMVLVTLGPNETFGELALVDGAPRSASAQAVEPTTLLVLGRTALLDVLREQPRITEAMLHALGALVRRLTDQAADLVFLDLHGRVAKLICALREQQGGGDTLDLHFTQAELASMVGGSRQSVNQILRAFETAGFLEVHGRRVVIRRPELLLRRAGLGDG